MSERKVTLPYERGTSLGLTLARRADDGAVEVAAVVPDSVAAAQGSILAGDVLRAVDGHDVRGLSFDETLRIIARKGGRGGPVAAESPTMSFVVAQRREDALVGAHNARPNKRVWARGRAPLRSDGAPC